MSNRNRSVLLAGIALAAIVSGCARPSALVEEGTQATDSLRATLREVGHAWLDGRVSDRFALVALRRGERLAEDQRSSLAASPETLADAAVAALADDCARLSRIAAELYDAVSRGDRTEARTVLQRV